MNSEIKLILDDVKRGELSVDDAALKIKVKPFEDIGYARSIYIARFGRALRRSFTAPKKPPSRSTALLLP